MADFTIQQSGAVAVVRLAGDLTLVVAPALQAALRDLLSAAPKELVFDLGATTMLDSTGIGLLIAASNSLGKAGGAVRVANVSTDILQMLRSMRLAGRLNVTAKPGQEDRRDG